MRITLMSMLIAFAALLSPVTLSAQQITIKRLDSIMTPHLRSKTLMQSGEFRMARKVLEEALLSNPTDPDLHELLGTVCFEMADMDSAVKSFTKAIQHGAKSVSVYNSRGGAYAAWKDWVRAIADYSKAISISPDRAECYYNRGQAYLAKHQYRKARLDFEAALDRGKENYITGSLSKLLSTCPDERVRDARKAVEYARTICERTNYNDPRFLDVLAAAHAESGDWDNAVHWAKKSLSNAQKQNYDEEDCEGIRMRLELYRLHEPYREMPPEWPSSRPPSSAVEALLYGIAKIGVRDRVGAIADLQKAVTLNPRLFAAHYNLGKQLILEGKASEAVIHFNRCLELNRNNPDVIALRAEANCILRKPREALSDAKEALALKPKLFRARVASAWALGSLGDLNRAQRELDELNRDYPDHLSVHLVQGECYLFKGLYDAAVDEMTLVIQRNPSSIAYAGRAVAYSALGSMDKANQDLENCVRLAPYLRSQTEERIKAMKNKPSPK